uniref:(northern house mosquito) hypothetical protein n=1 Tax=Culex pipiens TaxID=7175 RepID=A0A8D8DH97_CULPI
MGSILRRFPFYLNFLSLIILTSVSVFDGVVLSRFGIDAFVCKRIIINVNRIPEVFRLFIIIVLHLRLFLGTVHFFLGKTVPNDSKIKKQKTFVLMRLFFFFVTDDNIKILHSKQDPIKFFREC